MCLTAQTIFDLYLNYDCDEFLNNLFERLVNDVSRVSQVIPPSCLVQFPLRMIVFVS